MDHGALSGKIITYLGIILIFFLLHVLLLLLWYLPPVQPDSCQTSHLHVSETLSYISGYVKEGAM